MTFKQVIPDDVSHAKVEPTEPVCGDCMHCMPGPRTKDDIMARCCYRYPPTAMIAQAQGGGLAIVSFRPEIRVETIACGEYEEQAAEEVPSPGLTS